MQTCKAQIFEGALSRWIEEVDLVDEDLVIDSIHKIRVDCFLEISQGFEVADFFESEHIVIEELDTTRSPFLIAGDTNSDGLCVESCKIDGGHVSGY